MSHTLLLGYTKNIPLIGKFECSACDNEWVSAYAWKNYYQECNECGAKVITWNLWKHRHGGKTGDKAHCQDLCGKCTIISRKKMYLK